jgi:3-(3-hydroxy-phenyl)propionate hydroxylase
MTIKANVDVAGSATTLGTVALRSATAAEDVPHVAALRAAGAIPIARTNMPEFGMRWHTDNDLRGATRNPWSASVTPGGCGVLALGNGTAGGGRGLVHRDACVDKRGGGAACADVGAAGPGVVGGSVQGAEQELDRGVDLLVGAHRVAPRLRGRTEGGGGGGAIAARGCGHPVAWSNRRRGPAQLSHRLAVDLEVLRDGDEFAVRVVRLPIGAGLRRGEEVAQRADLGAYVGDRGGRAGVAPRPRRGERHPGTVQEDVPVLVVGAGPTGSVSALLLARLGVACTVVDRAPEPAAAPRAVHLDDGAVRVLQQVGLADAFGGISRPAGGLRLVDARLRPFARFDRDGIGVHGHPRSNLFDQPELERLLRAALLRHPLVTVRTGTTLTGLTVSAEGGPVVAHLCGPAGPQRVHADALLGCDGAGSTVRGLIGARLRDLGFTERWFVVDVRCARGVPGWGGVDQVCDPRRAATSVPLPRDRHRWEFRMRRGETAEELARPERLERLVAAWGVPAAELDVVRAAAYTFRARIADRWRGGQVLLLGDAAHQTPPFIGQGMGAGLQDAHNLAWKLAAALRGNAERILETYQAERAPQVAAMIRGAVRVGRALTGGPDALAALRRPAVGLLLRVPAVRARAERGIATRYPPGPLVDRPRHRVDLPGTPCPQPTVRVAGRPTRLDDVLGPGWALLTTGVPNPALAARAASTDARTVRLGVDVTDDAKLRAWLAGGGASCALVRPDRIVQATG